MKKYMILEAPVCVGSPTQGSEDAYSYLKENGLKNLLDSTAEFLDFTDARTVPDTEPVKGIKDLPTVMHVNRAHYKRMYESLKNGFTPIAVGGDHSIAMSSIAALSDVYGADNVAVVYIDGHTDINTENSSESGYIHGMPLASAMGLCCNELTVGKNKVSLYGKNTCIIGARSIDKGEYPIVEEQGVHLYTAEDVCARGVEDILAEVLKIVHGKKVHISFDVDCIDGSEFPATGYVMPNGLSYITVYGIIAKLLEEIDVVSFDCVEYNPHIDKDNECLSKLLRVFRLL